MPIAGSKGKDKSADKPYKLNDQVLTESEANRMVEGAAILAVLWVGLLAAGVIILLHIVQPQSPLSDVIFPHLPLTPSPHLPISEVYYL